MAFVKLAVLCLCAPLTGEAFLLHPDSQRNVVKILTVTNGSPWGSWHTPQYCAAGSYAVGYDMKIEGDRGSGDDTGLNAVTLQCHKLDGGQYGGTIMSGEAPWGSWVGQTMCDGSSVTENHFLTAFTMQVEGDQHNGDDTAVNFVKFMCRDFSASNPQYELHHGSGHGLWGQYGAWSQSCDPYSAICGIQTKIESDLGPNRDDTALNDMLFLCCNETN